mgnify:CR=1 FL=1
MGGVRSAVGGARDWQPGRRLVRRIVAAAQQSLYRRYRPRRFGEIKGQEHVVRALRNAVALSLIHI